MVFLVFRTRTGNVLVTRVLADVLLGLATTTWAE